MFIRFPKGPKTTPVECPTCRADHIANVEYDEDGPYAVLDTEMCSEDGCMKELCSLCRQFRCDGCQLTFCLVHRVLDGGLELCSECAQQNVDEGADQLEEVAVG